MTSVLGRRRCSRPRLRRLELEVFEERLCPSGSVLDSAAVLQFQDHPGFQTNTLATGDDNSSSPVNIGFLIDFYGLKSSTLTINNNGNVTFNGPLPAFTPFNLLSTHTPIIAPFFADVDTRGAGTVFYGSDMVDRHDAFAVTWQDVGYFSRQSDRQNHFQLVLIDRSETGEGNFDFEFNYDQVQWESGDASGGNDGLGGHSARVGYSNGNDTSFEINGSAVNGAFLDDNLSSGLIHNSSGATDEPGRYLFSVRNGTVLTAPVFGPVVGSTRVDQGGTLQLQVNAANPDHAGDAISYRLVGSNLPEGLAVDPQTGAIRWDDAQGVGALSFLVEATDTDTHLSSQLPLTITVQNVLPTISLRPQEQFLTIGEELQGISGGFTDPGTDSWTATVDYGTGPAPLDLVGKSFVLPNHRFDKQGLYTVTVAIGDGQGNPVTSSFVVSVLPDRDKVDLDQIVSKEIALGETSHLPLIDTRNGWSCDVAFTHSGGTTSAHVQALLYKTDPSNTHLNDNPSDPTQKTEFLDIQGEGVEAGDSITLTITGIAKQPRTIEYIDPDTNTSVPIDAADFHYDPNTQTLTIHLTVGEGAHRVKISGTVFVIGLPNPVPQTTLVSPAVASSVNTLDPGLRQTATFISRTQLTVTITASQDRSLTAPGSGQAVSTSTRNPAQNQQGGSSEEEEKARKENADALFWMQFRDEYRDLLDMPNQPGPARPTPQQEKPPQEENESGPQEADQKTIFSVPEVMGQLVPAEIEARQEGPASAGANLDGQAMLVGAMAIPFLVRNDFANRFSALLRRSARLRRDEKNLDVTS